MFVFEFKSGNSCLITKIVISGRYLTIYTNKPNSQELSSMSKEFNLKNNITGDHPEHQFCHNAFIKFSAMGDSIPHKHFMFPSIEDRHSCLSNIFQFLLGRQRDDSLRKQDFETFVRNLDSERQSCGHECFPQEVQRGIDSYDMQTAYLPENEINVALARFDMYLRDPYNTYLESVDRHAEEILHKHWNVLYDKRMIGLDEILPSEKDVCDYYDLLLDLRVVLQGIEHDNSRLDLHYIAINLVEQIIRNSYSDTSSFIDGLSCIKNNVNNNINRLELRLLLNTGVISTAMTTAIFMLFEWSPVKAFALGLSITGISVAGAKCAKPLTGAIKQLFFGGNDNVIHAMTPLPTATCGKAAVRNTL